MTLRQLIPLFSSFLALVILSGCGNKGDLFLIPDPVSQEEMEQFQRALEDDEVPATESPEMQEVPETESPDAVDLPVTGSTDVDETSLTGLPDVDEVPLSETLEVDDDDIYKKPGKKDNAGTATESNVEPADNRVEDAIEDPNTDTSTVD